MWRCALLFALLHLKVITTAGNRASFGEPCSPDVRCDSRNFLACSSVGQCDCLMPNSMIVDETTGQCVTLAGERCAYTAVEGDRSWSDALPCITNAACTNGICECDTDFYEKSNGTCHPRSHYDQPCTDDDMCVQRLSLKCGDTKLCECQPHMSFSQEYHECVHHAGQWCSAGGKCTENSECYRHICTCADSYFPTGIGTCESKRDLGEPCQKTEDCKDNGNLGFGHAYPTVCYLPE